MHIKVKNTTRFYIGHCSTAYVEWFVTGFQYCESLTSTDNHVQILVSSWLDKFGMSRYYGAQTLGCSTRLPHLVYYLSYLATNETDFIAFQEANHRSIGQDFLWNPLHNLFHIKAEFHFFFFTVILIITK